MRVYYFTTAYQVLEAVVFVLTTQKIIIGRREGRRKEERKEGRRR